MSRALRRPIDRLEDTALEFSFAAFAGNFDLHIRQSIRGYDDLISDCLSLSAYFVEDGTTALDIGCSAGTFLRRLRELNQNRAPNVSYVGVEVEEQFSVHWQAAIDIDFVLSDIRSYAFPVDCSFITSIFSLQFISEKERQTILRNVFNCLVPGGAFVLAEKTFSPCGKLQDMLTALHYDFKRQHFTEAEILKKERSLRSLMKPWTERKIIKSLKEAGFRPNRVQCFWKNHNFVGLLALKS